MAESPRSQGVGTVVQMVAMMAAFRRVVQVTK